MIYYAPASTSLMVVMKKEMVGVKQVVRAARRKLESDDFYDDFEIALEDDEITPIEAAFMEGFNE